MLTRIQSLLMGAIIAVAVILYTLQWNSYRKEKKTLRAVITAKTDSLRSANQTIALLEAKEQTVALAYATQLIKQSDTIRTIRRAAISKPTQIVLNRVEAISSIRPIVQTPLSLPPRLEYNIRICYDTLQYKNVLADYEELEYRRGRDSLSAEAYTRLSVAYSELYKGVAFRAEPGLSKGLFRGAKLRRFLRKIKPPLLNYH